MRDGERLRDAGNVAADHEDDAELADCVQEDQDRVALRIAGRASGKVISKKERRGEAGSEEGWQLRRTRGRWTGIRRPAA